MGMSSAHEATMVTSVDEIDRATQVVVSPWMNKVKRNGSSVRSSLYVHCCLSFCFILLWLSLYSAHTHKYTIPSIAKTMCDTLGTVHIRIYCLYVMGQTHLITCTETDNTFGFGRYAQRTQASMQTMLFTVQPLVHAHMFVNRKYIMAMESISAFHVLTRFV